MREEFETKSTLLGGMLEVAVPLRIAEIERAGGPSEQDLAEARSFAPTLGEKGDVLQFGGRKGEAADLFNRLARALAVLAFCPGGVTFLGTRYEARPCPSEAPGG
jgi:hypothetical protein